MLRRERPAPRRRPRARIVGPEAAAPLSDRVWRLKRLLHALTVAHAGAALGLAALILLDPALATPPWGAGPLGAAVLGAAISAYAAGDPRRRASLVAILAFALAAAALAQLAYLLAGTGAGAPLGAEATAADLAMIPVLSVELVLAAAVALVGRVALAGPSRPAAPPPARWESDADSGLRPLLATLAALAAGLAALSAAGPLGGPLGGLFEQPLLAAHLAAGAGAAAALSAWVASGIRDRLPLAAALALALAAAAGGAALALAAGPRDPGELLGASPGAGALLAAAGALALALGALLAALRRRALRSRLRPRFLGPTGYRALIGLADVLVAGPDEAVPPREIAANVDRYFAGIRARRRRFHRAGTVVMQLHPLLTLWAPFSELDAESRLAHLESRFHRAVRRRRFPPEPLRRYVQAMLRMASQLTYIGYYSDPRAHAAIGYVRFAERERYAELDRAGEIGEPGEHPLAVDRAPELSERELEADFCVIGSGAAGAILAHRLAAHGTVVVLERGRYVEPREFGDDEVEMIGRLYGDGVFQQSEDFRFSVLQGSCVGGSTVVNNAVSIPLPDSTLGRWNERHGAGIDPAALAASTAEIEALLRVAPQREGPENPVLRLNPSHRAFLAGVERVHGGLDGGLEVSEVPANLERCLGCGYCNIGCRYGRKLSMLDTVLPWAQAEHGPDRVRIVAECEVERIVTAGRRPGRVTAVEARPGGRRPLRVRARTFVLAAGAIASPYLLRRSGIDRRLPVGRHASFNMGAALTAELDEAVDAYDGLQISHFAVPRGDPGWVLETWWNPPVSQALNMPGWFDAHYENMRRYRRLMAVGALVGTERNARIGRALLGGPAIDYTPAAGDMRKLAAALGELGRILLAGGARSVLLNGWEQHTFTRPEDLDALPGILADPSRVALGTGHPQGGCAIGADPRESVVDPGFRVHGLSNLHVCDASVFPTSITVNPQLTVMALADYAAPRIAAALA